MLVGKRITEAYVDELLDPFWKKSTWQKSFALWPRWSDSSDKMIWLTYAYKGTATWRADYAFIDEYKWLTKDEYIMWQLTKD